MMIHLQHIVNNPNVYRIKKINDGKDNINDATNH